MSAGPRPYGSWPSPISAALVAAGGLRLSEIRLDGEDLLWIEGRPAEGGRCAVVRRRRGGAVEEALPPPFSARSGVHEYGGGAMMATGGSLIFTNQSDQRLYRLDPGGEPRPLTPPGPRRHADTVAVPRRRLLITVVEDHSGPGVDNRIEALAETGGAGRVLISGSDFYAAPRASPDGGRLAWLQWNQPAMPWDGAELWTGALSAAGGLEDVRQVAGGPEDAVFQPDWSPDGVLHFVGERTGWWNLYRWDGLKAEPVAPMEAECGRPMWVLGMSTYAFAGADRIALCACRDGIWSLHVIERSTGARRQVPLPFTELGHHIAAAGALVALDAGGPDTPMSVVTVDLDRGTHEIVRRSSSVSVGPDRLSTFETVDFPAAGGATAHGLLYRPRVPAGIEVDPEERPPLLVRAHGGPTAAAGSALDPVVQYWTSRGFAFLDVNYAGSTGYGRAYRRRLDGLWGVADVQDCVDGARFLAGRGDADGERLLITGGSAGGFIVLSALTFHRAFAAGASHYGIGDIEALVLETHKFEARYFDQLIGPYPQSRDLYRERSPLQHVHRLRTPVILFQGLEDAVVPPNQAETMHRAVADQGVPCALLEFAGEQHGFRQKATIERVLGAELYFYARVLGFEPPAGVEPVAVRNL